MNRAKNPGFGRVDRLPAAHFHEAEQPKLVILYTAIPGGDGALTWQADTAYIASDITTRKGNTMSLLQRSAIVSAMLASLSVSSFAQTPSTPAAAPTVQSAPAPAKKGHGPEAREAHMAQRMQALKASLKLNASQEAAWTSYVAAIKPQRPAPGERPERADLAKLTTPERIDAMQAMHAKHQAAMDQRNQATKAFYATLTPEQQKTFDAETLKMHERRGHGPEGKGPHGQRHQGPNAKQTVPPIDSK